MSTPRSVIEKKRRYHVDCIGRCDEDIIKIEKQREFHIEAWKKLTEELEKWESS
jgi:hypothetical protein